MPAREAQQITGIYRNFDIVVPKFAGVNEVVPPFALKDEEFVSCWNFLPTVEGTIKKIKAPLKCYSTDYPIVKIITAYLNQTYTCLIFLSDGSVWYTTNPNLTAFTQIAQAGTLSGDPAKFDFCIWQNDRIYVIDRDKGYFKYRDESFSQVFSDLKGDCILVWQGRVFIAKDSIVQYSVALNPEDFTGTGSGYFDLIQSFPILKIKVKKLFSYIDNLVIVGDSAILILTGTTISNDPSQWYLTQVSDTIGIQNQNLTVFYNNEIWLQNEKGLYKGIPTNLEKFDYKIALDEITFYNRQTSICQINNLIFYPLIVKKYSPLQEKEVDCLLFWSDTLREFYYVDLGFNVYGVYWSSIADIQDQILILGEDGLYKWEADIYGEIECYFKSKAFNLNNDTIEKLWRNTYFSILVYPYYLLKLNPKIQTEYQITDVYSYLIEPKLEGDVENVIGYAYQDLPPFVVNLPGLPPFFFLLPQTWIETGTIKKIHAICNFYFDAVGRYCSFIFREKSSTPFKINYFVLQGQVGRKII